MKLTMLGTGHAMVTECYNTCFALEEKDNVFLVDAGGGNGILKQLQNAEISWEKIQDIFITHKHVDHIMGVLWLVRQAGQKMLKGEYDKEIRIYGNDVVIDAITKMVYLLLPIKMHSLFGTKIKFIEVINDMKLNIIGHEVTFFDIESKKEKQFGFLMIYDSVHNKKITCLGDEPYHECNEKYAYESDWLMHEAFCLYEDRDIFNPYEKSHSTTKETAQNAKALNVGNLIVYHTEDQNMKERKNSYTIDISKYYDGKIYVPEDLESIEII